MAQKTPEIRISISVIWIVLGLFLPLEGALLWIYHQAPKEWKETIVFGASIVGGAFVLYSHMKHIEEQRIRYAQKLIERWNNPSPEFQLWKDTLRIVYEGTLDPLTVMRRRTAKGEIVSPKTPEDIHTRNRIVGLLSFCEEVAGAVRGRHADEEFIRRLIESVLKVTWEKFEPWIKGERSVLEGKAADNLYVELENLVSSWKRRG